MNTRAAPSRVQGPNLVLRLIQPEDAEYVHGLRTNPLYNRYLSEVRGTVEDQRLWILEYQNREASGGEYYYVIERKDGSRCGLVRLYDIRESSYSWGSWILDQSKPRKAALESALLSFSIGFDSLGLQRALVDVRLENERAFSFYQRFGMTETGRTDRDAYFEYRRDQYEADRDRFMSVLKAEGQQEREYERR